MKTYAYINNGRVYEIVSTKIIDGAEVSIEDMYTEDYVRNLVDITETLPAPLVGMIYTEDGFSEYILPPLTNEELEKVAISRRNALLDNANSVTYGMSDAYVSGLLSQEDTDLFLSYAAYKLALNKIDQQSSYPQTINWPLPPA